MWSHPAWTVTGVIFTVLGVIVAVLISWGKMPDPFPQPIPTPTITAIPYTATSTSLVPPSTTPTTARPSTTPKPRPSATPKPQPSASSADNHKRKKQVALPVITYQVNWAQWVPKQLGASNWNVSGGLLNNVGAAALPANQFPTPVFAPVQLNATADYTVNAVIQVPNRANVGANCTDTHPNFGVVVRGQQQSGYFVGIVNQDNNYGDCARQVAQIDAVTPDSSSGFGSSTGPLASKDIPASASLLDGQKHNFQVGIHGTTITLSIDNGALTLTHKDAEFSTHGQVGVYAAGVRISVSRFEVGLK